MLFLRRLAGLLLVAAGGAFLFLPFPERLSGERQQHVLRLEVQEAPFTPASARERFGSDFVELDEEGLVETPEVLDAVLGLMGRSGGRCAPDHEWLSLIGPRPDDGEGLVYSFQEDLHRVSEVERFDDAEGNAIACFEVERLGAYDNPALDPIPRLEAADLEGYPRLGTELRRLTAGSVPLEEVVDVSPRTWYRFQDRVIDDGKFRSSFVVYGRLVSGGIYEEPVSWSLETPWLRDACRVVGFGAVLLAIALFVQDRRSASSRRGLPVASGGLALFCNLVLLAGAVFLVTLALDTLWVGPLGQPSLLGLEPEWPSDQPITGLHFVSIFGVLLALPLLTLFFTSLYAQRIWVDEAGVTSHGAIGSSSMAWSELEGVRVREQRNPFSFTVVDFRSLQRVVDLEGADWSLTINEPSSRTRKQAIVDALRAHAPEPKRGLLDGLTGW